MKLTKDQRQGVAKTYREKMKENPVLLKEFREKRSASQDKYKEKRWKPYQQ